MMRSYKEFDKVRIGCSDIATLILVGCEENGIKTEQLHFGEDGSYEAYVIEGDADIGEHYRKVAAFSHWMKIYDDEVKTFDVIAKEVNVYRAGEFGCIIQVIR